MKIAKTVLNKIINEEYSGAVARREKKARSVTEFVHHFDRTTTDVDYLVFFANRWAQSGKIVQENVEQLMTGDFDDLDPAAIQEARGLLGGFHPDLDEAFSEYEKHINGDD